MSEHQHTPPTRLAQQAKVRCFGSKAALTAEATVLRQHEKFSTDTLNIEVAPRRADQVLWQQKITLQLGDAELPLLACVCLGYLPHAEFKRPNKGLRVERQAKRLFFAASQGAGNLFSLPVPIGQSALLTTLVLAQWQKMSHTEDGALALAALRGAAGLYRLSD